MERHKDLMECAEHDWRHKVILKVCVDQGWGYSVVAVSRKIMICGERINGTLADKVSIGVN